MIIEKTFEVVINLIDINDIFSNDIDSVLLNKIKHIYENKCFKSCFITNINGIIERGMLNINKRSLTCETSIDVKFSANVIIYEYLEVINNNVIDNITKSRLECRSGNIVSYINIANQDMSTLSVGQIIPIRVGKATYQPLQSTISVNAFPFIPTTNYETYYLINELDENDKELLTSTIIVDINNIDEQLRMVSKDRLKFFKSLLHPYKTILDQKNNIKDLLNLDISGIVCLSDKMDLYNHQIINVSEYENPISESGITIYKIYLNTYLKYIRTILDMCITYKDDEVFESHQNVFQIYEKFKINI